MNKNLFSAGRAEHSTVRGVNQTIELVNLSSVLISFKILIKPIVGSSLDIFPFNIDLSSSCWVILFTISGMDHAIKLTDLKDCPLLFSFLLSIVSLKHIIVDFFVV